MNKEELIAFLKENLDISTYTRDYETRVEITLCGEVITSDTIYK